MSNGIRSKATSIIKELEKNKPDRSIDEKTAYQSEHLVTQVPVNSYSHSEKTDDLSLMKELREQVDKDKTLFEGLDPEKYMSIWKEKDEEYERLQFYRFVFTHTDMKDPYIVHKLQEMFPEIYKDAEKAIDETSKLYERLADINFRGLKTRDDWLTAYNISRGKIQFDVDTLHKVMGLNITEDQKLQEQYEYGIIAPSKWKKMKYDQSIKHVNPFKPFKSDGSVNYTGPEYKINNVVDVMKNALTNLFQ